MPISGSFQMNPSQQSIADYAAHFDCGPGGYGMDGVPASHQPLSHSQHDVDWHYSDHREPHASSSHDPQIDWPRFGAPAAAQRAPHDMHSSSYPHLTTFQRQMQHPRGPAHMRNDSSSHSAAYSAQQPQRHFDGAQWPPGSGGPPAGYQHQPGMEMHPMGGVPLQGDLAAHPELLQTGPAWEQIGYTGSGSHGPVQAPAHGGPAPGPAMLGGHSGGAVGSARSLHEEDSAGSVTHSYDAAAAAAAAAGTGVSQQMLADAYLAGMARAGSFSSLATGQQGAVPRVCAVVAY